MKKLIQATTLTAVAAGLVLTAGCEPEEDPNAINADENDKTEEEGDPESELKSKGEKQHKPKGKKENPDDDNPEG